MTLRRDPQLFQSVPDGLHALCFPGTRLASLDVARELARLPGVQRVHQRVDDEIRGIFAFHVVCPSSSNLARSSRMARCALTLIAPTVVSQTSAISA